jgi:hypothetical protein
MNTGNIMDSTRKQWCRGIRAVKTLLAIALAGALLAACGPAGGGNGGNGNGGNGNGGNGNGGNSNGGNSNGTSQQLYIYPQQGYVELITLDGAGSSVTGSLSDVYNCGNDQVNAAPSPIPVSGTSSGGDVDLDLYGIGNFAGVISGGYLSLTAASGSTVAFHQTSTAGLGQAVVQGEPPVYTISGYTCDSLPATIYSS